MQFYKYAAALLLESHGGEGGDEIPQVWSFFFFLFALFVLFFSSLFFFFILLL